MACSHLPISVFIYVPLRPPSRGCIEEEGRGWMRVLGEGVRKEGQVYISCAGPNSCVAGGGARVVLSFSPPAPFP